jgi:hypothetical protein
LSTRGINEPTAGEDVNRFHDQEAQACHVQMVDVLATTGVGIRAPVSLVCPPRDEVARSVCRTILYLSKKQFDAFGPPRVDETITEEVEWFADDQGVVIGIITREKANLNSSIAIFGRDQHGTFHAFDTDTEVKTIESARRQLFAKMDRALKTSAKVFPRRE